MALLCAGSGFLHATSFEVFWWGAWQNRLWNSFVSKWKIGFSLVITLQPIISNYFLRSTCRNNPHKHVSEERHWMCNYFSAMVNGETSWKSQTEHNRRHLQMAWWWQMKKKKPLCVTYANAIKFILQWQLGGARTTSLLISNPGALTVAPPLIACITLACILSITHRSVPLKFKLGGGPWA